MFLAQLIPQHQLALLRYSYMLGLVSAGMAPTLFFRMGPSVLHHSLLICPIRIFVSILSTSVSYPHLIVILLSFTPLLIDLQNDYQHAETRE